MLMLVRPVPLLALLAGVVGCSPIRTAEFFLLRGNYERAENRVYGDEPRQVLDVYTPKDVITGPRPVVVYLYGGRWQAGSKDQYRLLADALTERGAVVVVPDYRLAPAVAFPAWVNDAAQAIRWARDSIEHYGGDPHQLFVMGHSAGAHTAALLALDSTYLEQVGLRRTVLSGVVSIAGPVATEWTDADVQALMGPRDRWGRTYPLQQVDTAAPPLLLLHGREDQTVSPENSHRLAEALRQQGGCAEVIMYPDLGHVEIILALALARYRIAPVVEDVIRFMRAPTAVACRSASTAPR